MSEVYAETVRRIYLPHGGDYIEVKPDPDGLNLVEISYRESTGKALDTITIQPDAADELARVLPLCATECRQAEKDGE